MDKQTLLHKYHQKQTPELLPIYFVTYKKEQNHSAEVAPSYLLTPLAVRVAAVTQLLKRSIHSATWGTGASSLPSLPLGRGHSLDTEHSLR